ncbi:hypothetical protein [Acetobacter pasteurianus]|uniref:hypothetical protein n=2 Tax=Acetobacter pasteurianus TaxID=438 RepID=UPI0013645524|nr:hypothetical protein [Acetobacter pasteurianus]QHM90269.1 hypothetical protein FCN51_01360 [Acetobacter pasteurianus]
MGLDIYLISPDQENLSKSDQGGIFIREGGQTKQISRSEWDIRYPGVEPTVFIEGKDRGEVFSTSLTHNLGLMAREAGLYGVMWHPEENGIITASDIIPHLEKGLITLVIEKERMKPYNPSNGWGSYDLLFSVTQEYLRAAHKFPEAKVEVCR